MFPFGNIGRTVHKNTFNISTQRFLNVDEIKSSIEEIVNSDCLQNDEAIDVVQLPPDLHELTDLEDFDDDNMIDQEVPREEVPSGPIELQ